MKNNQSNPYLSGNYAPVHDELEAYDLKIIGEIPKDLTGIYMRNGPNPAFSPIAYHYPFDGDGMIHAVYIKDGKAAYRNRYVKTKALLKERSAGKALYGSVLNPIPLSPEWQDPENEPVAIKNGAFIHVIRHANRYLALLESSSAYEITKTLETRGKWKPVGAKNPIEVCAHTRLDPKNGDLWFINYSAIPPYLTIYRINAKGEIAQKLDIKKSYPSMIHDFGLTENYVIIFDCPVVFNFEQVLSGGQILNWQPELGVRIGVMSRHSGKITWFESEAFFIFHFANAYEQNDKIVVDYIRHQKLNFMIDCSDEIKTPPTLYRTVIDMEKDSVKHIQLDEQAVEFPRIREDCNSFQHQFIYATTSWNKFDNNPGFNALIQYDVKNNSKKIYDFGKHAEIGEAVFAPKANSQSEEDGYIILFVYDSTINKSELVILDGKNFTDKPLACIQMPRRVPHGLHGSWMYGEWCDF